MFLSVNPLYMYALEVDGWDFYFELVLGQTYVKPYSCMEIEVNILMKSDQTYTKVDEL